MRQLLPPWQLSCCICCINNQLLILFAITIAQHSTPAVWPQDSPTPAEQPTQHMLI
jgi:hypothetical protein